MITRRSFLPLLAAPLLAQTRKPNIVLILTDDQGYGDLSLHGNPNLATPNIDAIAKAGAQFSRFYSSPVCSPTRSSLLTGRYNYRTGVVIYKAHRLPKVHIRAIALLLLPLPIPA